MSERLWDENLWEDEESRDENKSENEDKDANEKKRIAIAVLTQLCDCIVWWTQRYKTGRSADETDS